MPIVRPLSWIVAVTSVGVVILGARVVSGRRVRLPESVVPTKEKPAPPPKPAPRVPTFRPAAPTRPERPTSGLAHLRGRVIAPPGTALGDLQVVADDGQHAYEAETNGTGEFQLHLPARTYDLVASIGSLVGVKPGVRARPGQPEPVDIDLGPGAALEGTVKLPPDHHVGLQVSVRRSGRQAEEGSHLEHEEGRFEVAGLIPGALYDLTVSSVGLRPAVVRAVTVPARLQLALQAAAVLRGAIGFPAGASCPVELVSLTGDDGLAIDEVEVDRNCRFQFGGLPAAKQLLLRASGNGWHLEQQIAVPEEGDPEPVCLNPPCLDLPPAPPAKLEVIITGAPTGGGMAAAVSQEAGRSGGCGSSGSRCEMDLEAGVKTTVRLHKPGCAEIEEELIPKPGPNTVTFPCRQMRLVEGIARGRDRAGETVVSCRDGGEAQLKDTALFRLFCPRDATELRYRTAHAPWRSAPLTPAAGPAFVELTL